MGKKLGKFLLFAAAAGAVAGAAYYYIKKKEGKDLSDMDFDEADDLFAAEDAEEGCCRNYVPLNTDCTCTEEEFPPVEETESGEEAPAVPESVEEFFDEEAPKAE